MKGVDLYVDQFGDNVLLSVEPLLLDQKINAQALMQHLKTSDFANYYLLEDAIASASDAVNIALSNKESESIEFTVAQRRDAEVSVDIEADKMLAQVNVVAPYMGRIPTAHEMVAILNNHDITRGISTKNINSLLNKLEKAEPGESLFETVAKGLPPKTGKNSYIQATNPSPLERILTPRVTDDEKVDMRDFGDILCVAEGDPIAVRMPPTAGRSGYTVTNKKIASESGEWLPIKLGDNVRIDDQDENLVVSEISGLPKVSNSQISVDNVFTTKGVNVATGNVKFDGSVIVKGDVTEKMRIIAKGDVTIEGYAESAYIEAGGDIIILQGASGKMQGYDCDLVANGSVFLQHGQGLNITSGDALNVGKQLAYSNISCAGNITVGPLQNPNGKLFASEIRCGGRVIAGHVGAVSGSTINFDFSDAYNKIQATLDSLNDQFEELSTKNADHEIKISKIKNRKPSKKYNEKLASLIKQLEYERLFLNWIRVNREELKQKLEKFEKNAKICATQKLFPGVNIKLNKKKWEAKQEYQQSSIVFSDKDWHFEAGIK